MIAKSHQCQLSALATAVLLTFSSAPACALSLGRVTVQSALGEPLQAEVDFLDINAEEAASLAPRVASPDAFKAAGLEYNAALGSLKTTLQRRANGSSYIKLSSERIVNEPFIDIILEASWSSGRIVRDYTLLFDPPNLRSATTTSVPDKAQLPIQSAPSAAAARTAASPLAQAPVARSVEAPVKATPAKPSVAAASPQPVPQGSAQGEATVRVQAGQTAGQIAAAHKPANVSLDQMLVAMLRGNPNAFIQDNVNRIKAGAIVALPTPEQAAAVPADEATRTVVAQSQDFNEFRQRFASNVPRTPTAPVSREATGRVQALVQDKARAAAAPDKLTLSKGTVQGKTTEDQLAGKRNAEQASARAAEVAKNISDLNKIAAASAPASAAAVASASASAAAPAASATPVLPSVPASAQTPASAPRAVAALPARVASKPAAPAPVPEPSFIDNLLENPLLPGGVVALLGLLGGLAYFKTRQRKRDAMLDSAFVESSLAEPFSGASGGQSVDTGDSLTTGSSMVYSPSQLDAADAVDPVAEADVYLAYGRDLQAEEILKDALRTTPQRVAIHVKLAEIYAKRRDVKAFEAVAALAFNLTNGSGADWEQICEKGLSIDPDNALYLPGGQPGTAKASAASIAAAGADLAGVAAAAPAAKPSATSNAKSEGNTELDFDLDFSLDEPEFLTTPAGLPTLTGEPGTVAPDLAPEPEALEPTTMPGSLDFTEPQAIEESQPARLEPSMPDEEPSQQASFIADLAQAEPVPRAPAQAAQPELPLLPELALEPDASESGLSLASADEPMPGSAPTDMMSFNLDSLSLDLDEDRSTRSGDLVEPVMDALETKLALAEEFRAIGDDDGARALIEEVIAEASGEVKARAQQALNKL